jgi:hypothetical protein
VDFGPCQAACCRHRGKKSNFFDTYSVFADSKALFVQGGLHFAFLMDERRISKDGLAPNFFGETYR